VHCSENKDKSVAIIRHKEYNKGNILHWRSISMDYITAQEAADKWGITRRRVQVLCVQNRIEGAKKMANLWLIPKDAEKPCDPRKK
jgi:hypothetical protein